MTFGESCGVEDRPPELPANPTKPSRRLPTASRLRLGGLIGILAVLVAPPVVVSIDRVGEQMIGVAKSLNPADIRKGDHPQVDATDNHQEDGGVQPSADGSVRQLIKAALDRQAAALRADDLAGFLSPADPADEVLRTELSRRFTTLRAMRAANWSETVTGRPVAGPAGSWSARVQLRYCFVVETCTPVAITVDTGWQVSPDSAQLTSFGTSPTDQVGPRPWEVSDLQAVVGDRVIVAGTKRWANRLQGVLNSAERAARVTDRYAKWSPTPTRYVVYVAGPDEWAKWYGVQQAEWVAAYAMPLTDTYTEIVLNANKVSTQQARVVLQHEFTHVVTLAGVQHTYQDTWWMIEGIAEYVQNVGAPLGLYQALDEGRRYVRGGRWNGNIALGEPDAKSSNDDANGRYAVAFLAVRRMADRFGEAKMLDFFNAVARQGKGLDAASATVYGESWATVSADCAHYVRRALG